MNVNMLNRRNCRHKVLHGGSTVVAWSRVLAKFKTNVLNFSQPPHFTFTFHTSSCCHHPALLPDHGMHHGISSPPRPALYGEATSCWYFPPKSLPSPVYFPGELVAASLVEQRLRSVPPCMVILHCQPVVDFTFLCSN